MLHLLVVFRTSTRQARYDHRFQTDGLRENIYVLDNEFRRANSGDSVASGKRMERGAAFFGIALKTFCYTHILLKF